MAACHRVQAWGSRCPFPNIFGSDRRRSRTLVRQPRSRSTGNVGDRVSNGSLGVFSGGVYGRRSGTGCSSIDFTRRGDAYLVRYGRDGALEGIRLLQSRRLIPHPPSPTAARTPVVWHRERRQTPAVRGAGFDPKSGCYLMQIYPDPFQRVLFVRNRTLNLIGREGGQILIVVMYSCSCDISSRVPISEPIAPLLIAFINLR